MLVLTREPGSKIYIGKAGDKLEGPIVIDIAEVRGRNVRLAIDAQRNISIVRDDARFVPPVVTDNPDDKLKPLMTTTSRERND